jgi:type II secretory pathway component PulF
MQFTYTAKTVAGEIQTGHMASADIEGVKRTLREQNLFLIDVRKGTTESLWKALFESRRRTKISKRDLLSVTTQLAIMTRSGVDLASAYESLSQQSRNPHLRRVLSQIHLDLTGGRSVSDALRAQAWVFGEAYVASVAAGEAAGRVPEVLTRLSQLERAEIRIHNSIRTLLAYPILLTSVSSLVVMGLVGFVLPQFQGIFSQFDLPLPKLTQVIIAMSNVLREHIALWVPVFGAMVVGLLLSRRLESGKKWWDSALLNTLVIRDITRAFYIGRTFRLLGLMIESGVPLLEGLRLTRNAVHNSLYRKLFDELEDAILNGRGLASSLISAGFVPPVAAEMVLTAERTGTLGMVTQLMGEHYEEEGESKLRELATLLEPLIIVVMGVVVATIVMSVMLPMFDIATLAR